MVNNLKSLLQKSRILQIFLLIGFWLIIAKISAILTIPLPANVVALLFLLALFLTKIISPKNFELGAKSLLGEIVLFLIPAVVAFIDHPEFFSIVGVKILIAITLCTTLVMLGVALIVDIAYKYSSR